jgi:hypothetical protein
MGKCAEGYEGQICGECNQGWVREPLMVCKKCVEFWIEKNKALALLT